MSRQTLEIVQHLKGGHLEAAIGHELDGHVEAVGMADEIAAGEHDRPEARGFHGAQFFFEGTGKRIRVHREFAHPHGSLAGTTRNTSRTKPACIGGVASRVIHVHEQFPFVLCRASAVCLHVGYHGMRSAYRQYRRRQASSNSPAA